MKSIEEIIISDGELLITHSAGRLMIEDTPNDNFKGIKRFESSAQLINSIRFKHYNTFSKLEMERFQNILLRAYVFQNDLMDEAIEKEESRDNLESIKEIILVIRKHLRYIAEYVDSYDEILDEYKEV